MQPVPFSRATRSQVLTADLILHLMARLKAGKFVKSNTKKVCDRILQRIKLIKSDIGNGIIPLPLSHPDIIRYHKLLFKLTDHLKSIYNTEITIDLLNAIMLLAEEAYIGSMQTSKTKLTQHWRQVNKSLLTLYTHLDPEFEETEYMQTGERLGEELKKIIIG